MRGKISSVLGPLVAIWAFASAANAAPVDDVIQTARASFDRMPNLVLVEDTSDVCGGDETVNQDAVYCTSLNNIYLRTDAPQLPYAAYLVAHLLGHAVQVQHGVADVALREITRRRAEEQTLRTYVESQVDCIAGFLLARSDQPPAKLTDWFASDPFSGPHWGRNPLSQGPQVTLDIALRDQWFQTGYAADDLGACAVGEFGAELLLQAYRG